MFLLRHIPGKKNVVADWGSRMYMLANATDAAMTEELGAEPVQIEAEKPRTVDEYLKQVHGGRMFHYVQFPVTRGIVSG
jgi:hypothetical protein